MERIKAYKALIEDLRAFKEVNGHIDVPQLYTEKKLGRRLRYVRDKYWKKKLPEIEIAELEGLGIKWKIHRKHIEGWNEFLVKLKQFKKENGHCNVPYNYKDKWLAIKVVNIRQQYRKGILSGSQIRTLEKRDFKWQIHHNKE